MNPKITTSPPNPQPSASTKPDPFTTLPSELAIQICSHVLKPWSATTATKGRRRDNILLGAPPLDLLLVNKYVHDIAVQARRSTYTGVLTLSCVDKADVDGGIPGKSVFENGGEMGGFVKWIRENTWSIKAKGDRGMTRCLDLWERFPRLRRLELNVQCFVPAEILRNATVESFSALWQENLRREGLVDVLRHSTSGHLVRLIERGVLLRMHLVGYRIVKWARSRSGGKGYYVPKDRQLLANCTTEIDRKNVVFVPGTNIVDGLAFVEIEDCVVDWTAPRYWLRAPEFWD